MPRSLAVLAAAAPILALAVVAPADPALATTTSRVQLPSPNPPGTTGDTVLPLDPTLSVPIRVYLSPRAGLAVAATAASTPGGSSYRRYQSAAAVRSAYGATAGQITAVRTWLTGQGMTVTATTPHYLAVDATVAQLDTAFDTQLSEYDTLEDAGTPFANVARSPGVTGGFSVPSSMATDILSVTGIDEIVLPESSTSAQASASPKVTRPGPVVPDPALPTPAARAARAVGKATADEQCSQYWHQHDTGIPVAYGHTTAPTALCGYTPNQMRAAYGVTGSAPTGRGRTIAILLSNYMATAESDADTFFTAHGLAGFRAGQYRQILSPDVDSTCQADSGASGSEFEASIDIEAAHAMAPDANIIYVGVDCGTTATSSWILNGLDGAERIVDQHLADVVSGSWGLSGTPAADMAPWEVTLQEGALEGIGFVFSSGDGGDQSYDAAFNPFFNPDNVQFPASDPWVTSVGGTTLGIGSSGTVVADYPWGDNWSTIDGSGYDQALPGEFADGSGGGVSTDFAEPAYQQGKVPNALAGGHRVMPDISADAGSLALVGMTSPDFTDNVYAEIAAGGGTSESAPLIAGLLADASQSAGAPIGFANPALYRLSGSSAVHDVTAVNPADPPIQAGVDEYGEFDTSTLVTMGEDGTPGQPGILVATAGYDDVTGIGAPNPGFAAALGR